MLKDKDSKQSIQVTIRVRPLSDKEKNEDPRICVHLDQSHSLQLTNGNEVKKFTFDSISYEQSQQQIFERVGRRCTKDCLQGYNCTIFAYGQTGAGKTYTMMGVNTDHERYEQHRGLIPRTMAFLFDCIDKQRAEGVNFIIRCSFLEIYNEQIIDLLNKNNTNLQLREDTRKGVYVEGITEEVISRSEEIMDLLAKGAKSRHVGSTFYNETSSRSHSVLTMQIESRYTKNGVVNTKSRQFNFIDLAGSERTKQSTGDRLKEGCNINKSLMNLASVINALSEVSEGKSQHVNYRNSKLTFLLKDSLGGNSKTDLIANISPSALFYQETLSTLSFARRAKLIKRERASINEDSSGNLDSMKNEIKRLKQEVITLMSRLQSGEGNCKSLASESAPQMTTIMHEYVSEEIDKQTSLQMEILRLKERITHLQTGIKQYSSNETHLRMIISVLEDKIARLKNVETRLSINIDEMASNEDEAKIVKEYFDSERVGFIKQLEALKGQTDSMRIIKELLKQAKVMRDDGEQQEALKELLTKNTAFLAMIHGRLQELIPEKQEIEFNAEFLKKVSQIEIEYHKKEQELLERMEQSVLELEQAKSRIEENERLLEEAINIQIALEEKNSSTQQEKENALQLLRSEQAKVKTLEDDIKTRASKTDEIVAQLKNEVSNLEMRESLLKKEADAMKAKIEKLLLNEKILKEEFDSLQEEKYKLDKMLLENIQQMKDQKNLIMKAESQNSILLQQLQQKQEEKQELSEAHQKVVNQLAEEKKNSKTRTEEMQRTHLQELKEHQQREEVLSQRVAGLEQTIRSTEKRLNDETEELEILARQYQEMENQMKAELQSKEVKIKQLSALINEKEENGNEAEYLLNKLKADIINLKDEKQTNQSKLKKTIEEYKDKIAKEHQNFELLEAQATERAKLYEELSMQQIQKKRELQDQSEKIARLASENAQLKQEVQGLTTRLQEYQRDIDGLKQKEKQQRVQAMEMKNQLFMAQKNSQIELDAVKSQLNWKEQQLEQIERQHSKHKLRYEQQISQLQKQLAKNEELSQEHEKSLKKSMEAHLLSKEKKLSELRAELNEKENTIRQAQIKVSELTEKNRVIEADKVAQQQTISSLKADYQALSIELEQLSNEHSETLAKHEKEIEESELVHNDQLDQKNQQIEILMNQISDLTQQQLHLKATLESDHNKFLQERQEKAKIQVELQAIQAKTQQLVRSIATTEDQMEETEAEKQALEERIVSVTKQKQVLQAQLTGLCEAIAQGKKIQDIMKQEKAIASKELALRQQQLCQLEEQLRQAKESLQARDSQISQLSRNIAELNQTQERVKVQKDEREKQLQGEIKSLMMQKNRQEDKMVQQASQMQTQMRVLREQISKITGQKNELLEELNTSQCKQRQSGEKVSSLSSANAELTELLEHKQEQLRRMIEDKQTIENLLREKQQEICIKQQDISGLKANFQCVSQKVQELLINIKGLQDQITARRENQAQLTLQIENLEKQKSQIEAQISEITQQSANKERKNDLKLEQLRTQLDEVQAEVTSEREVNTALKQRADSLEAEVQKLKKVVAEDRQSKERLYGEVCKERENNNNFKLIIENSEAQVRQLEVQLQEKDAIYKKLLEKIAKNESQNKKTTSSEHYLKTIELLEKSRAEQLNLRRENEDLKKIMTNLKENMEEKENYIREVEKKSENYCVSMHKRLEQIQKDYFQLEKNQERLIKEKKALEKFSNENDNLKEEIRTLKTNANKMVQRQEELESRFKKCNIDYIQLEKEFEELKKGQILITNHDDKTNYINRLKAEVAALKTEKVLLTDSLSREREEKTKLKAEMRFGKDGSGDISGKVELEKKINENKNLQELIFEIVSHLKICVNEPKTKLETIRSVILGTIKQKNNELKTLREKIKQLEEMQMQVPSKVGPRQVALKEFRGLNSSAYSRNMGVSEQKLKFEKEKDPSILDNHSRQKMRQFQNYYARFKQNESGKYRNM